MRIVLDGLVNLQASDFIFGETGFAPPIQLDRWGGAATNQTAATVWCGASLLGAGAVDGTGARSSLVQGHPRRCGGLRQLADQVDDSQATRSPVLDATGQGRQPCQAEAAGSAAQPMCFPLQSDRVAHGLLELGTAAAGTSSPCRSSRATTAGGSCRVMPVISAWSRSGTGTPTEFTSARTVPGRRQCP